MINIILTWFTFAEIMPDDDSLILIYYENGSIEYTFKDKELGFHYYNNLKNLTGAPAKFWCMAPSIND